MKRKHESLDEEEKRLSKLLFNKPIDFKIKESDKVVVQEESVSPAWIDDDDEQFKANKVFDTNNKDLYTNTLKQKYQNLVGTPSWARLDNKHDDDENEILKKVGHLHKAKSVSIKKDFLEIKKFPKINSQTNNEGPVIDYVEFHPTASVALIGGQSGRVSLYSICGDVNNILHSFRLKQSLLKAHFTPNGTEAFIGLKNKKHFCVYNLITAVKLNVEYPRVVRNSIIFELSPGGKYLVVSDGFEEIYLIDTKSKELIRTMKHNFNVVSATFSHNEEKLYAICVNGEVAIWNLSTYRIEQKFYDQGCITASCITASACGNLIATGSNEGIVNVYETTKLNKNETEPLKTIDKLKTKITNVRFNNTSEILAVSSSFYPNAVKLVHIPSYHVFSNFPIQSTNLHQVGPVSFSPNSGYMALGNNKNCAYLYRLKHYENY